MIEIAVLVWLVVIGPLLDIPLTTFLKRSHNPKRRIFAYVATIAGLLVATCALLPTQTKLLESPFGPAPLGLQIVGWSLVATMAASTLQLWLYTQKSPQHRLEVHHAFSVLDFFLPATHAEQRWFVLVALAAGICEEILFRSFIVRFFGGAPVWTSAIISSILFGIAHLYQGWKNAIGTLFMALVFSVVVAGTETLIVAMIAHVLWDLRVLLFLLPVNESEKLELLVMNSAENSPSG